MAEPALPNNVFDKLLKDRIIWPGSCQFSAS
jgi:ATP-dependent Clp protease protease subunit